MRRALSFAAAAALLTVPMSAQADSRAEDEKDEARIVMRDFADCLVKSFSPKRAQAIDAFLAISPYASTAGEMGRKLATAECLSSRYAGQYIARLQMAPPLLRGGTFRTRTASLCPRRSESARCATIP